MAVCIGWEITNIAKWATSSNNVDWEIPFSSLGCGKDAEYSGDGLVDISNIFWCCALSSLIPYHLPEFKWSMYKARCVFSGTRPLMPRVIFPNGLIAWVRDARYVQWAERMSSYLSGLMSFDPPCMILEAPVTFTMLAYYVLSYPLECTSTVDISSTNDDRTMR